MIGEVVGSYRVTGKLGEGGMGAVYSAEHQLIGRKAAIKILLPETSRDEVVVNRFFNEARATALIQHAGLVDIFDFGYLPDGCAYIAMELLEGESLASRIGRGPMGALLVVAIARQLAAALGAAHDKGIIHRDLKPDNIFLVPDEQLACGLRVKVLDFGIAKLTHFDVAGPSLKTRTGAVMGTPIYMSPEQCRNAAEVDARSDVYALGCVLFEMLTGRPPFMPESLAELLAAHLYETPAAPSTRASGVPAPLDALVLAMLAKRPDDRPASMAIVKQQLDRLDPARQSGSDALSLATGPHALVGTGDGRASASRQVWEVESASTVEDSSPSLPRLNARPTTLSGAAGELAARAAVPSEGGSRRLVPVVAAVIALGGAVGGWALVGRSAGGSSGGTSAELATASTAAQAVSSGAAGQATAPVPTSAPAPAAGSALAAVIPPTAEAGAAAAPPTAGAPRAAATASPAQAGLAAPRRVKLSLASEPAGAEVYRAADGVLLGKTPLEHELAASEGQAVFVFKLAGHADQRVELPADRDGAQTVQLQAAEARPPARPVADRPSTTKGATKAPKKSKSASDFDY
jgi:serine/threonine-protein kinase